MVDRAKQITRGNYDKYKIFVLIESQIRLGFVNKTINLNIDHCQYRGKINWNEKFAIAWYSERSILQLLNFGSQSCVQKF